MTASEAYPSFSGITHPEKLARDRDRLGAALQAAKDDETVSRQREETASRELGLLQREQKSVDDEIADIDRAIDESEAPRPLIGRWLHIALYIAMAAGDIIISTERFHALGMEGAVGFGVVASLVVLLLGHLEGKLSKDNLSPESPTSRWGELIYLGFTSGVLIGFIAYYTMPPLEIAGSPEQQSKEVFYTGCIYFLLSTITSIIAYHGTDVDPHRRELRAKRKTACKSHKAFKHDIAAVIRNELEPAKRKLKTAINRRKRCLDRLKTLESQIVEDRGNVFAMPGREQAG